MAGGVVKFRENGRNKLAKTLAVIHWLCIIPSFICLFAALFIQITIEDKIFFIEDYNGAILPGVLVFTGMFGVFTHILSGKVTFSNRRVDKRKKWAVFLLPVVIVTFVIFVSELACGIMCFVHVSDLGESFDTGIRKAMAAYGSEPHTKEQMDVLQMSFDCCGSRGYSDWFYLNWIHTDYISESKKLGRHADTDLPKFDNLANFVYDDVPFSCCNTAVLRPCIHHHVLDNDLHYKYDHRTQTTLHTMGCTERLMVFYENSVLFVIGSIVLSMSFLQLFTAVGCRYLQTAVQGAIDSDDPEGPSVGYLFMCGKGNKGLDDTATTDETSQLLETTEDTETGLDETFDTFDGEFDDVTEPVYENVPPYTPTAYDEAYDDGHIPGEEGEHIYHDSEVEEYLATKFAASREQFEPVQITPPTSDPEDVPEPDYEIPITSAPPPPPPPPPTNRNSHNRASFHHLPVSTGASRSRTGHSLTALKQHHGSYMAMNMSNSSVKKPHTASRPRGPFVYRHVSPSSVSLDDSQPYVINMKSYKSPSSPVSPLKLSLQSPPLRRRPGRVFKPYATHTRIPMSPPRTYNRIPMTPPRTYNRIPMSQPRTYNRIPMSPPRTYPPRHSRPSVSVQTSCAEHNNTRKYGTPSPRKKFSKSSSTFSPYIYNTCSKPKRSDSPKKSRSPEKAPLPEKLEFRPGISYECIHSME